MTSFNALAASKLSVLNVYSAVRRCSNRSYLFCLWSAALCNKAPATVVKVHHIMTEIEREEEGWGYHESSAPHRYLTVQPRESPQLGTR